MAKKSDAGKEDSGSKKNPKKSMLGTTNSKGRIPKNYKKSVYDGSTPF